MKKSVYRAVWNIWNILSFLIPCPHVRRIALNGPAFTRHPIGNFDWAYLISYPNIPTYIQDSSLCILFYVFMKI